MDEPVEAYQGRSVVYEQLGNEELSKRDEEMYVSIMRRRGELDEDSNQ